ncbi:MAG: signal peptidase II [Rubinisphaera brasiliensis]|uniref:signal peptidase II n=1 Tax=Rubinisphaera brasiliensis TaxID=119 RepID=UPI00391880F0
MNSPTPSPSRPAVPAWHYVLFAAIAIIGTIWDLGTKSAVFSSLGYPGRFSEWTQTFLNGWVEFRFLTSFNEGALWGMGQGFSSLFALLSVLAAIGILTWLTYFRGAASLWLCVTLGLVLAGTLGNLYDRLGWHGNEIDGERMYAVRDFLAFTFGTYHYPIFNFADVFLVTGAIMLGVYSFFLEVGPEENSKSTDQTSTVSTPTPATSPESSS